MSFTRSAPFGPLERTMMFSNSSARVSRPRAVTVNVSAWPAGAGSAPILPTANCEFCPRMALATSVGVTPSCAMRSGLSQMRIDEPAPKTKRSPTPGMRFSSSVIFVLA